ncbi:MAG: TetR/AcrR family transcriptional regulator [Tindallia sp. MSAO_Bac2]|nr:MAG: TetR/AcrR family transcriptional regulator [Tindallia sp. MSAO_Bac2]
MPTQAEIKHQRLMDQAERLIITNGFKNVTMEEIAAAAGISKMTIYNHFDSKEHLVEEILMRTISRFNMDVVEALTKARDTFEKLEIYFQLGQRASEEYSAALYKDVYEAPYLLEKLSAYKKETTLKILLDILEKGAKKGEIRAADQEFVVILLDVVNAGMMQLMPQYGDEEMLRFNRRLFQFIRQGLMVSEGR